jgi:integrase
VQGIEKRINKDGSSTNRARVRIKGHPSVSESFSTLTLAKKWKRNTESAIEQGRFQFPFQEKKHTLAELVDRYIESILPTKPKNARNVKQHLLWWKQELGHCLLSDIKPSHIAQKRDELLSQNTFYKKPRSSTTVVRYIASLSHAFAIAIKEWEWIIENPIQKINKPRLPQGRIRFLDESEIKHLLNTCKESGSSYLFPIVVMALSTGMRKGEILSLRWNNIDLDKGAIILQKTKNGERRLIPLVGLALNLLKNMHAKQLSELIFPSTTNLNFPIDIRSAWEKTLKKALINDFKFHDLRHTAASYLAMNQVNLLEIGTFLGHKTVQMTKRYSHLSNSHLIAIAQKLDAKIFENSMSYIQKN